MKIFITADKVVGYESQRPTLFSFDTETLSINPEIPYCSDLDAVDLPDIGRDSFRPFGIGADKNYLYIASNTKIGKFSKKDFSFCGLLEGATSFINTHEICVHNNCIYTSNAANDSISVWENGQTKFFDVKKLVFPALVPVPKNAYEYDTKHINSIEVTDSMAYVVALNEENYNSAVYFLDPKTWNVYIKFYIGRLSHGIRVTKKFLYSLSTGTGQLMEYDKEGKLHAYFIVDPVRYFLRGIRYHNGLLYFVASQNFKNKTPVEECWLYVFDVETKTMLEKYDLSPIRVVADIFILEE